MPPQQPSSADLAKQFGGKSVSDLAAQFGGKPVEDETQKTTQPAETRSPVTRAVGGYLTGSGLAGIPDLLYGLATHPIDTATGVVTNLVSPLQRLANVPNAYRQGGMTGAANEVAASIPILGPAAEHASQRMQSGDTSGGLGEVAGLATMPFLKVPGPVKAAVAERVAPILERGATRRMVETIAPKTGANKPRFGNMAVDVSPRLAREEGMGAATRQGLADKAAERLSEAESTLDAANDARLAGRAYLTQGIIQDLLDKRAKLTANPIKGSHLTPEYRGQGGRPVAGADVAEGVTIVRNATDPLPNVDRVGRPIGSEVVPAPIKARVAQIDQAIAELRKLGTVVSYDALKRIRQAYDGPAKARYNPSLTADYMTKQGESLGAADVTSALRERLGQADPMTAKANASYAFWKKVNDVMQAAEETQRVQTSGGRTLITRATGAVSGAVVGHDLISMATGVILAEGADRLAASGLTTKVATARAMTSLADALRKGDTATAKSSLSRIAQYAGLSARLAALLNQQEQEK